MSKDAFDELRELFSRVPGGARSYAQGMCIHDLFTAQAERTPNTLAVISETKQLTYRELNQQANQLAYYLRSRGVGPEVCVGICLSRSVEIVIGILGILKAGGVYVPLDPDYPPERLNFMIEDAGLAIVLAQEGLLPTLLAQSTLIVCLDGTAPVWRHMEIGNPLSEVNAQNLAYILYTSGSTGQPKGVGCAHSGVLNLLNDFQQRQPLAPGERCSLWTSFGFDVSVYELFSALLVGGELHLVPEDIRIEGMQFIEWLYTQQICSAYIPPILLTDLHIWLQKATQTLPLRRLLVGVEPIPEHLLLEIKSRLPALMLINGYGPTETTICSTLYTVPAQSTERRNTPIGRAVLNTCIYLLDPQLRPVPRGVPGDLYIGGIGLARGYLPHPEITAERFIPNPFSAIPGERMYKTGDIASYLPDGNIEFLGRADQQIKLRGLRIELGEIENALKCHPAVREAVVALFEDDAHEKQLIAYVVRNDSTVKIISGDLLRIYLQEKIPTFMVPTSIIFLDTLPLTPNGKIDRRGLPAPAFDQRSRGKDQVAPRTLLEEHLAAIWCEVLKRSSISVHDNFFELGGHSLLATRISARIYETLRVKVSLRTFFEFSSVAEMAVWLEQSTTPEQEDVLARMPSAVPADTIQLSFAQQRLWFLDQLEPGNPFYTISVAIHLEGDLQIQVLERCFGEIIQRHEALRTAFVAPEGKPQQVITPAMPLSLPLIDLEDLPIDLIESAVIRQIEGEEGRRPFDLSQSPLLRAKLVRVSQVKHILLLSMHHIVSDDWSMEVFFNELSFLYETFVKGGSSPLPALPIQYVDYVLWQRRYLEGSILEEQLSYWRQQLSDLPLLQLPIDRPYPPVQTHRGATWPFFIPPDLTAGIRKVCLEERATLFMVLLAALQVLLYRHTGQDDIVVGSPIANRTRSEVKDLIGFFANTLVFRVRPRDTLTFRIFLEQVRQLALDAYAHQEVPFEKVVEELQPERNLIRHPLFQVAFALLNDPVISLEISNLGLRLLNIDNGMAKFDLTLFMRDEKESLAGTFEYNTDIFETSTIASLSEHLCVLLRGIISAPETMLGDLPLLTDLERDQLLVMWNNSYIPYPADRCVHELFEDQVVRSPNSVAVSYDDEQITFHELNRRANQLAHALQTMQIGPEMVVGVALERSLDLIIGLLGILKTGGAYLPLDLAYPRERLAFLLEDAHAVVVLTQSSLREKLPECTGKFICLDSDRVWLANESDTNPYSRATADNLAYVIYTSGSTGQPKGVAVIHKAINRLVCNADYVQVKRDDHIAQASNAAFDAATFEIWGALLNGGRLVGVAKEVALDPQAFSKILSIQQITILFVTTALFNQGVKEIPQIFQSLRTLLFGGEAVDPRWVKVALEQGGPERLLHVYGPTENTTFSSWYLVRDVPAEAGTVPIGHAIANTQLYILDQCLQPVPHGVRGELYIGGDGLARGYLGHPTLTATHFVPHPFSTEPGARLYKTGDVVRLARGNVEFLGRVDHQIKLRGFRIELGEIEAMLNQLPSIQESVVVMREDIPGDKRLIAYVVPHPGRIEIEQSTTEENLSNEHIATWQEIFDDIYHGSAEKDDTDFNIVGWNSSYTNQPLPPEHMQEWVEHTLEELRERERQRVLEIGCGTGLLLFRLAPHSSKYWGTDFSATALQMVQRHAQKKGLSQVQLLQRMADDFSGMEGQLFDTIILNSVVQYFPNINYLLGVLEGALQKVAPGGTIFIGDIRNQQLLMAFHLSIEITQCGDVFPLEQFHQRIHAQMAQETELLLDPAFFYALQKRYPQISQVCIRPKRGRYDNELTAFRYNVQLKIKDVPREVPPTADRWLDWQRQGLTIDALHHRLLEQQPTLLMLTRIPNARLISEIEALRYLSLQEGKPKTVGELRTILASYARSQGVTPEDLYQLGQELGYRVDVRWSGVESDGSFDAAFWLPKGAALAQAISWIRPAQLKPWSQYANQPLRDRLKSVSKLAPQIRKYLQERLSDYMIPSTFILLDALPLNANGKVDRKALPLPGQARPLQHVEYVAPRNPIEEVVAGIWVDVLSIEHIGVHDNFFEIGGHSLLATQVISRICHTFQIDLPLRALFEAPTIESLSHAMLQHEVRPDRISAIARVHMRLNQMSEYEIQQILQSKKTRG
ncbi:MAG TPA: amino acid adenylation domain-containing protein [Ktedonosporobacter sp.]|nr:amino acid adenylation domain-containing protein [Ktedonosporobacter sp.]